jgi:hypothetical protein
MTGTKEQAGLRKPANWTTQVGAVHGEDLELISFDMPDPTRRLRSFAVRRGYVGIPKRSEPRLTFRKLTGSAERYPITITSRAPAHDWGQKESHDWYRKNRCHQTVA